MFTKKPLGGMSCASCERNLINVSGQIADYQPWKKLPYRENNERISKVNQALIIFQYGPGFSKILSMLKPDNSIEISRVEQ